jgi:hypothetical protein
MPKPTSYPQWASLPTALKTEPPLYRKENGYSVGDKPNAENFNWILNNLYEWIKFFDEAGFLPYKTLSELQSLNGNDFPNNSFFLVEGYGIYRYDSSSTLGPDNLYIISPADNVGRFILFVAEPLVQNEIGSVILDELPFYYYPSIEGYSISNRIFPLPFQINSGLNWAGKINSFLNTGGKFVGYFTTNNSTLIQTPADSVLSAFIGGGITDSGEVKEGQGGLYIYNTTDFNTSNNIVYKLFVENAGVQQPSITSNTNGSINTFSGIFPNATNNQDIGSATLRYSTIYLQNTPNVACDIRIKRDIIRLNDTMVLPFFTKLREKNSIIKYKFNNISYEYPIYENGKVIGYEQKEIQGNRYHLGIEAQKIVETILELGITTRDCSLVSINNYQEGDENKINIPIEEGGAGLLTVAYDEFVPLLVQATGFLIEKVNNLEERISILEGGA